MAGEIFCLYLGRMCDVTCVCHDVTAFVTMWRYYQWGEFT